MKNWGGAKGLKFFLRWWLFLFFFFWSHAPFPKFFILHSLPLLNEGDHFTCTFFWEIAHLQLGKNKSTMSLHQSYSNNFVIGFGFSRSLPLDHLPTHFDLASHIFHLQSIEPPLSKSEILKSVSQSLMSLCLEAAASSVGTGGIRNKIRKLIERVEVFKKNSCLETKRIMVSTCFVRHYLMHMPLWKGLEEELENWCLHLWE